jgi:hypothetical protein
MPAVAIDEWPSMKNYYDFDQTKGENRDRAGKSK